MEDCIDVMSEFEEIDVINEWAEFCDDLVDDIFFYNMTNNFMPDDDIDFILKKFSNLEFMSREYGVML